MAETLDKSAIDKLWDFNDPAASEKRFREFLSHNTPVAELELEVKTQLARTQGLQRKFEEAHRILDEVEARLQPTWKRVRVRYLLERGRAFNSSRQPEKARPLFFEACELAQAIGEEYLAVDAAHMLGIIGTPVEQLEWNLKALALAESASDPRARGWLGALYNNIGWTYHDQGQFEKALGIFEKALIWRAEQKQVRETQIAKWCVARTLRSLHKLDVAFTMQYALKEELNAANTGDGFVDEELGECLLLLKREVEAKPHFAAAFAQLSQDAWLVESEPQRLERLKQLAGV